MNPRGLAAGFFGLKSCPDYEGSVMKQNAPQVLFLFDIDDFQLPWDSEMWGELHKHGYRATCERLMQLAKTFLETRIDRCVRFDSGKLLSFCCRKL